jgi:hypothetical protein
MLRIVSACQPAGLDRTAGRGIIEVASWYYERSPMKTISLKLPESLDGQLALAARKGGRTKSEIVREILEDYLRNDKLAQSGSCLELAADLVGCVKGPGDLSFNKQRLRGFGQ